nr:MAG TPA: hypothetical protein [Caudoviricetes sp.]
MNVLVKVSLPITHLTKSKGLLSIPYPLVYFN